MKEALVKRTIREMSGKLHVSFALTLLLVHDIQVTWWLSVRLACARLVVRFPVGRVKFE